MVVVEKEWGRIEEISLTYVVVQLWDPAPYDCADIWFIDRPFENWTRTSSELLGTVFIYTDYAIPSIRFAANSSVSWPYRHIGMDG